MDETLAIEIFDTCFKVCLAFAIFFLILSVVLFFIFDIRTIYSIRTGSAKRKTIREMQAANDSTGRLRVGNKTLTTKLPKNEVGRTRGPVVIPPPQTKDNNSSGKNKNLGTDKIQENPTEVLQEQFSQTEVLSQSHDYDDISTDDTLGWDTSEVALVIKAIDFKIVKNEKFIHTNEVIF